MLTRKQRATLDGIVTRLCAYRSALAAKQANCFIDIGEDIEEWNKCEDQLKTFHNYLDSITEKEEVKK